ncbi:MAG TPA: alpha-mannosidase, partial [Terriglobales bacterium]
MHRFSVAFIACCLLINSAAQTGPLENRGQPALARLESLTALPADEWRVHEGSLLNAEDPALDDSTWAPAKPRFRWRSGTAWFRRSVEVPEKLNGYDLTGATLYFQFQVSGETPPSTTIYVNGSRAAMGVDLEPIVLFQHAQPRQKVSIAIKVSASPGLGLSFRRVILSVRFSPQRPDPGLIREQVIAAQAILQAIPENQSANLERIQSAVAAIDVS